MKKQLLLVLAFVATSLSLSAQTWNFSNFELVSHEATTTIDGLTIHATSSAKINVTNNNKTFDGVSYTRRLQFGGAGNWTEGVPTGRIISFPVTGNTIISVIATTSNNDDDRTFICSAGDNTVIVDEKEMPAGVLDKYTFSYVGEATTIYLYSKSGGINLYNLEATPAGGSTGITDSAINKEIVSTEYYNLVGVRTNEPTKGINMVKSTMSDGSVSVEKVYIP